MYYVYRLLAHVLHALKPRTLERVGAALGSLWFYVIRVRRAEILANLARAFPELSEAQLRQRCRRVMQILTSHFLETATLLVASDQEIREKVEWDGYHHIEEAMADGKGVLILATHIDNWELLIQGFGIAGIGLNAAVRMPTDKGVNRALVQIRERALFHGVEPKHSIRTLVGILGENKPVTVVMDQTVSRRRGVFVNFFGEPAMTTPGLAVLALKSHRPVIPVIPHRVAPGKIRLQAGPPIPYDDLWGRDDFIELATARFTAVVEANIRRQPERWLWAHRRFKVAFGAEGDTCPEPVDLVLRDDGGVELSPSTTEISETTRVSESA